MQCTAIGSSWGLPSLPLTTEGSWIHLGGGSPNLSSARWCQYQDLFLQPQSPHGAVTNEEVLRRENEDRQIPNAIWQRKRRRIGHVSRQWSSAWNYWRQNERQTNMRKEKNSNARRFGKWWMALETAAGDREGWRHRERLSKTCSTAEDYWRWWFRFLQTV